ncbi:MAG: hypothetical protein H6609_02115 [Ignavibacteriales bacterium]|nr:hypothetical protein [Ignavibacteriales bacterium]
MKILIFVLLTTIAHVLNAQCLNSLKIHSHNNYEQKIPLFDALKNCAKSIEADVHLKNDSLFVAHDNDEIEKVKTLEKLYLEPLAKILDDKNSEYYFNYELILLIDFKTDAVSTFEKLNEIIQKYKNYMTYVDENNNLITKNIRVIISGNRPDESLLSKTYNYCFIDGRTSDIGKNKSTQIYPLISDDWVKLKKTIENSDDKIILKNELKKLVDKIHSENKLARIWGIPDDEKHWQLQLDIGIDLINTDRIDELRKHLIIRK